MCGAGPSCPSISSRPGGLPCREVLHFRRPPVNDIAKFLSRFPPFDHLTPDLLDRVAAAAAVHRYAVGEDVFVEDGPPTDHLHVVYGGSMELRHDDEVIDILEPGESFLE